jgi:hypothetical protein
MNQQRPERDEYLPRKPNEQENDLLTQWLAETMYKDISPGDLNEAAMIVDNAYIAVFDQYMTGGPGYSGRYMLVAWDGSTDQFDAFTFQTHEVPNGKPISQAVKLKTPKLQHKEWYRCDSGVLDEGN